MRGGGGHLPDEYDRVRKIFKRRGTYGRFKDFLDDKDRLQTWYDFETQREETALRHWCRDNSIDLAE